MVDPAGGSYYVETLTVNIAEQAWKLFLATEEEGGFFALAGEGKIQAAVNESSPNATLTWHAARKSCSAPTSTPTSMSLPQAR